MQQRHARMLVISPRRVEPVNELVQSTDQSFHHLWLLVAALIVTTV